MDILSEKSFKKQNSSSMSISSFGSKEETNYRRSIDCENCENVPSLYPFESNEFPFEESKRDSFNECKETPCNTLMVSVAIFDEDLNRNEIIHNLTTELSYKNEIQLEKIIDSLRSKGFYLKNKMIFIYDFSTDSYLFAGKEGELRETFIKSNQTIVYPFLIQIQIKVRSCFEESRSQSKPKTIKEIIAKVAEWRRSYNGKRGVNGNYERKELDDSALDLGIPKKTLDDYMFQLRKARAGGFDFDRFGDESIGFLREFNKRRNPIFFECRKEN